MGTGFEADEYGTVARLASGLGQGIHFSMGRSRLLMPAFANHLVVAAGCDDDTTNPGIGRGGQGIFRQLQRMAHVQLVVECIDSEPGGFSG